jgi:hypothetical protein
VDLECGTQGILELVATEVVATIKLNPTLFRGYYRVWFGEPVIGWKVKICIYYDYNDTGPLHYLISIKVDVNMRKSVC